MPNRLNAIVLHGNDSQIPTLVPSKLPGLSVWYVQIIFPDGRREQAGAFCDKAEANDWIARRSGVWLVDYERRRINAPWLGVRYRSPANHEAERPPREPTFFEPSPYLRWRF